MANQVESLEYDVVIKNNINQELDQFWRNEKVMLGMLGKDESIQREYEDMNEEDQRVNFGKLAGEILPSQQASCLQLSYNADGIRNLKIVSQFTAGDIIFMLPYNKTLNYCQFAGSRLSQYLHWLNINQDKIPTWKILAKYESELYIKEFCERGSAYNLLPEIYLFQIKFMSGYEQKIEYKWFKDYAQLLPCDYSLMPYRYASLIQQYHEDLASSLREFCQNLHTAYEMFKDIVYGKNISQQYRFLSFLKTVEEDWSYYYQRYCQQFTFDNFQWAYFTWKTRAFDRQTKDGTTTAYAPIIDMINHSQLFQNAAWQFRQAQQVAVVKAIKHINTGDELFIYYGQRSIQQSFKTYGFIEKQQACSIKFEMASMFATEPIEVQMNQLPSQQLFAATFKERIQSFILSKTERSQVEEKIRQQLLIMQKNKLVALDKIIYDLQNVKYTQDEKKIVTQVQIILQKQLSIISMIIKVINLIF